MFQAPYHPVCDVVDPAQAVNLGQYAALGILRHHSFRLPVVQVQPMADHGLVVVASPGFLGAVQETGDQFLVVGSQLQDDVKDLVTRCQNVIQLVNLARGARVAVQQEA